MTSSPDSNSAVVSAAANTALVVQRSARAFGGFVVQRGNAVRSEGMDGIYNTKTSHSTQAMRMASMYAPAMPAEVTVAIPKADTDAPKGHMTALPAGHTEEYRDEVRERFRKMKAKWLRDESEEETKRLHGLERPGAIKAETYDDVVLPLEFPRDEYGVKIGNYPQGVRFLKQAIQQCGGALPLDLLERRLSQLADIELKEQLGDIRRFLDIHKPSFLITVEENRPIVRLQDDPRPDPRDTPTWKEMVCPLCSRVLQGRNFGRHMNCRKCVGVQLANGMKGVITGPVSAMASAAKYIMEHRHELDDDDLFYFAECLKNAGEVRRLRWGPSNQFAPVLKCFRVIRQVFLTQKGVNDMADVVIAAEDRAFFEVFRTIGKYQKRLPISWIETGDLIDMSKRFCDSVLPPFPPPPVSADPRIRVGNEYPGVLFAESDTDVDDQSSGAEDEFSDDEGSTFEFAPPVRPMEAIMVAGNVRETKRLNYRLLTSPPVPIVNAVRDMGKNRTLGAVHADVNKARTL